MNQPQSPPRVLIAKGVSALVLSVSLFVIWWASVRPSVPIGGSDPDTSSIPEPTVTPPGLSKIQFYERDLVPLLDKANKQNHVDADKAMARLHEEFDQFRTGVPRFAEDVTSWGTRFGVVGRMTRDKWENLWKTDVDPSSEAVRNYMIEKFETHIMSGDALQKAINSTLSQFREDMTANRNLLLKEIKLALTTRDIKLNFSMPDSDAFQRDFDDCVARSVKGQGQDSLENAVLALAASTAGSIAVEQLVLQIIRLLTAEAVTAGVEAAVAGGSTTASGGAVGGAAGWLGGPAGGVIGVGVGLVIGAIIDWWVTDKFKANVTAELTTYLENLERDMIEGVAATETAPRRPGLRETLGNAADKIRSIQSTAVLKAIKEAR